MSKMKVIIFSLRNEEQTVNILALFTFYLFSRITK